MIYKASLYNKTTTKRRYHRQMSLLSNQIDICDKWLQLLITSLVLSAACPHFLTLASTHTDLIKHNLVKLKVFCVQARECLT